MTIPTVADCVVSEDVQFLLWDASDPTDRDAWCAAWERLADREPQAHPAYCEMVAQRGSRILCAAAIGAAETALLPLLLRPVSDGRVGNQWEAITPYGHGGPFGQQTEFLWGCLGQWARENRVVGLVIRHDLNSGPRPGISRTVLDQVVVNLGQGEAAVWDGMEGRVRTGVRKARQLGVEVRLDPRGDHLDQFIALYQETMVRLGAESFYRFSTDAFQAFAREVKDQVLLAHALVDGQFVASEMQLLAGDTAYYFLAGSNDVARRSCANHLVKWETIRLLAELGIQRYVLGGGRQANDSLFRYKRSYAPRAVEPYQVTYVEYLADVAERLEQLRRMDDPGWVPQRDFLPAYRAPARTDPR